MKHPLLMGVMLTCALSAASISLAVAKDTTKPAALTSAEMSKTTAVKSSNTKMAKVNINKATAEQLQALNGVGEAKAKAIVEYRNKYGKFKNVQQLTQVAGIGEKLVEKNAKAISL
ncbi:MULTISPECIES: helix-hairpin-helix domain-containing protein [unclassified Shewanella]|uniref:ComEA family DNA-binding protein n=1 Tax=unclassified Shewanella TaxID=196818 RepID=UPI000970F8EE|nr:MULTISPECIES: helix-hairpin-helix domain-containing protein [unclassified Shewanella]MDO6617848.1 helix-hairpin-helix domain-containing protein [Shewanella sp. 6_MG-2023]MDO6639272.1 helix-hairpin-helix domain-containing protein [Shewanella sp. 5_MG-2023]MDO6774894.1 helix-hairpin-helix domain-containing protein [Shewanella sp. 3_MG-2023]PMG29430.1 hypothetical protein BCU94_13760 [Shewanella sp. 10N.286.52.C2]PMG41297.1 hypothetical protein BCU91_10850 [Shewanella sp. 10N.286.52.B9]